MLENNVSSKYFAEKKQNAKSENLKCTILNSAKQSLRQSTVKLQVFVWVYMHYITMSFCDTLLYKVKLEEVCVASVSWSSKDVLEANPGLWSSWSLRESFWLESGQDKSTDKPFM